MSSNSANELLSRYAILNSIKLDHYTESEVENDDTLKEAIKLDLEDLTTQRGPASTKIVVRNSRNIFQRGIINSIRGTW
jgi:hypothetical protein